MHQFARLPPLLSEPAGVDISSAQAEAIHRNIRLSPGREALSACASQDQQSMSVSGAETNPTLSGQEP
jgi:hypothetical protein